MQSTEVQSPTCWWRRVKITSVGFGLRLSFPRMVCSMSISWTPTLLAGRSSAPSGTRDVFCNGFSMSGKIWGQPMPFSCNSFYLFHQLCLQLHLQLQLSWLFFTDIINLKWYIIYLCFLIWLDSLCLFTNLQVEMCWISDFSIRVNLSACSE